MWLYYGGTLSSRGLSIFILTDVDMAVYVSEIGNPNRKGMPLKR